MMIEATGVLALSPKITQVEHNLGLNWELEMSLPPIAQSLRDWADRYSSHGAGAIWRMREFCSLDHPDNLTSQFCTVP